MLFCLNLLYASDFSLTMNFLVCTVSSILIHPVYCVGNPCIPCLEFLSQVSSFWILMFYLSSVSVTLYFQYNFNLKLDKTFLPEAGNEIELNTQVLEYKKFVHFFFDLIFDFHLMCVYPCSTCFNDMCWKSYQSYSFTFRILFFFFSKFPNLIASTWQWIMFAIQNFQDIGWISSAFWRWTFFHPVQLRQLCVCLPFFRLKAWSMYLILNFSSTSIVPCLILYTSS